MEATQVIEAARWERPARGPWFQAWSRLRRKKVAFLSLITIIVIYGAGILAPWVAPYSYSQQDLDASLKGPTWEHPFGTDRLGRDLLSRIIWGARTNVIVTFASVFTGAIFAGIALGGMAGYFGRWWDTIIMRVGDMFLAFPGLLLVILIAATVKPRVVALVRDFESLSGISGLVQSGAADYFVVFGALALFSWVGMARLVRGQVLSLKETQYVDAAQAMGASHWRIIFVHILPNALSPVIVTVSMGLGAAAGSEVVLSWLGVGVQPPNPSWGAMIFENQSLRWIRLYPHLILIPSAVVGMVIFAFNLLGDGLNDALNPRTR